MKARQRKPRTTLAERAAAIRARIAAADKKFKPKA